MNKIKILYIITKSDIGGAQKYVADLAGGLDKDKFESKILYGGPDRSRSNINGATAENFRPASDGMKWLSNKVYPWLFFANDWLAIYELVSAFKKENPDIVHLNSSKAGVLGSIAAGIFRITNKKSEMSKKPLKVVFTAHGWVFNPTNHLNPLLRLFYIGLHKFTAHFQDEIICVSEYDYQLGLRYGIKSKDKLHTIHNGINPNIKFLSKEEAREEILSKLKVPGRAGENRKLNVNNVWVGSIGRLVREKNYETFVRASAQTAIKQKNGKVEERPYFFLIGEGPELEKLKAESKKLKMNDRFFFINPSGNDAKYLKAFDVFIMSSIKEGLPYILLEAMAAELPIVVTEAGGIPEIIKNHQNGLMVSQKNPEQLAKAISGLIANPPIAEELGKSAKTAVAEHFNIKKMIEKTERVYEE